MPITDLFFTMQLYYGSTFYSTNIIRHLHIHLGYFPVHFPSDLHMLLWLPSSLYPDSHWYNMVSSTCHLTRTLSCAIWLDSVCVPILRSDSIHPFLILGGESQPTTTGCNENINLKVGVWNEQNRAITRSDRPHNFSPLG